MKLTVRIALCTASLAVRLMAADAPAPAPASAAPAAPVDDQKKLEDAIMTRLADHAIKKGDKPVTTGAKTPESEKTGVSQVPDGVSKTDPTMLMPKVEVNQSRITQQRIIEQEKEREIAREKQNSTPTGLDAGLNDEHVSKALAIFGGASAEKRAQISQIRVESLETERDLLDEIARAPTKEEREALKHELDVMRTNRREMEKASWDDRSVGDRSFGGK